MASQGWKTCGKLQRAAAGSGAGLAGGGAGAGAAAVLAEALTHAEDLAVQEAVLPLFARFSDPRTTTFAGRHRDVIARFGCFPHRNAALGWGSTEEKRVVLQTPGSRF